MYEMQKVPEFDELNENKTEFTKNFTMEESDSIEEKCLHLKIFRTFLKENYFFAKMQMKIKI